MANDAFYERIGQELAEIDAQGLTKRERVLLSPQGSQVRVATPNGERDVLNLCANNYLGLASDARVIDAAIRATRDWGAGLASVRFICGTQLPHKQLEAQIADYLGFEDAILFAAAFDANGAVFEPLFGPEDSIVSDSLNHASLIDGIRLAKARRYRFATNDMAALEEALQQARREGSGQILIVTDGVFSMDGTVANLAAIADLAERYGALTLVDDCHATGFLGEGGRGSAAFRGVEGRIDIVTGTFGKALGGAMGGFVAARRPLVELLRQRGRPYLFSNALAPSVCGAAAAAIDIARSDEGEKLRTQLTANATRFRAGLEGLGFTLLPGEHPIIPVMLHDAPRAVALAERLLDHGVYVTAFSFPVVPKGLARIRTQMSAAFTSEQVDRAVAAFGAAGRELGIVA
ncbi:glycine C-acetyltransferase [Sphingomonas colocasiae]|uniref:2-amino-3-ketobutyrate coenzyme A ligase n=1 Tax=Sphingomonas colocasiae TaxID=1848973 RepID=A0ABS7PX22_9SPHN|nr:glycine C-acetyltransferase [Sphingomonas colocasiae]MBY8825691.1 glycine C-acetyltransferase [Sphingomonas colocasiae]